MKHARLVFAIAALLTGLYLVGIALDVAPWLRGPEEWRWAYAVPATAVRLWLPALLLVGYGATAVWLAGRPATTRRQWLALLAATVMTPALQLALLTMDHPDVAAPLFYRTVSPESGGFFNVGAVVTDIPDFLHQFPEQMADYPVHPQRHPPGLPLLFAGARAFFDGRPDLAESVSDGLRGYQCHNLSLMNLPNAAVATAVVQMAVPFLLGLVVWPLYRLGQTLYDEETAVQAVLVWPLVPSIALWATRWNQLYALFTVLALLAFHHGLARRRLGAFFWSGLVVSVASFFSFGNVAIAGFLAVYALVWLAGNDPLDLRWLVAGGLLFAAGLSAVWLAAGLAFGLWLPDIWQTAMGIHLGIGRTYTTWLVYHLYGFFVFLGIPLAVLWLARFVGGLGRAGRQLDAPLLAFGAALLLLDLSGTSQGEVARVWAFLLPLFVITAVAGWPRRRSLFAGLVLLLSLQVFVANIFLRTVGTGLIDPPPPPPVVTLADSPPVAVWQNGLTLRAIARPETAVPGEIIPVDVFWSADEQVDRPYTLFIHLLDENGALAGQWDGMAQDGRWPTTCWQPGVAFADRYTLTAPDGPGVYTIQVGFYWLPTLERLPLTDGTDSQAVGVIQVR